MLKEIDINKIEFLPVSKKDLVLSLDRLTRFKYPEIRYLRVFSDLLCKYLKAPKLSKNDISLLDTELLKKLVEKIWNESVKKYSQSSENKALSELLKEEIYKTYYLSEDVSSLVNISLNISGVLSLIEAEQEIPLNLKRLLLLDKNPDISLNKLREKYSLSYPVEKVVLCEGITEEILLPEFARLYGYDFDKNGIRLIGAGGKNQVAKMYVELKQELKIPVFILLDADAVETSICIKPVLRECDCLYLIKHGEFEDIFSLNLIKRTINNKFKNICECCVGDFKCDLPMTKILADFYRVHELGDFQKAEFAKELAFNLKYKTDLTEEICQIIDIIKAL